MPSESRLQRKRSARCKKILAMKKLTLKILRSLKHRRCDDPKCTMAHRTTLASHCCNVTLLKLQYLDDTDFVEVICGNCGQTDAHLYVGNEAFAVVKPQKPAGVVSIRDGGVTTERSAEENDFLLKAVEEFQTKHAEFLECLICRAVEALDCHPLDLELVTKHESGGTRISVKLKEEE